MAEKIIVGKRIKYPSYFELGYTFILDVPVAMQGKDNPPLGTTKTITGLSSYANGTGANPVKADLIDRYNAAQSALNSDTTLDFWGVTWDGSVWT